MQRIKKLEEWMTWPEAAAYLGVSKQGSHKMVMEQELISFDDCRKVGDKPTYLVRIDSVRHLKMLRDFAKESQEKMEGVLAEVLAEKYS